MLSCESITATISQFPEQSFALAWLWPGRLWGLQLWAVQWRE